jgi:cytochrome c oxidase subunit 3
MTSIQANPSDQSDEHGHEDHEHGHDPNLAHHFDSMEQQMDSGKLGMWLFLATEVLFFGGLFVAYAVLRARNPEVFSYASLYLDTIMGGINTCVLILSSLTMALAVRFAQQGRKGLLILCLWLTMGGAVGFLVIKYFEYSHKIHDHLVWGGTFYEPVDESQKLLLETPEEALDAPLVDGPLEENAAEARDIRMSQIVNRPEEAASSVKTAALGPAGLSAGPAAAEAAIEETESDGHSGAGHLADPEMPVGTHLFFGIYFCMTGLHGIHVLIGMAVIGWLIWRSHRGDFGPKYNTPVDLGGLYWHIVDLIWIFLFPLFYLIH